MPKIDFNTLHVGDKLTNKAIINKIKTGFNYVVKKIHKDYIVITNTLFGKDYLINKEEFENYSDLRKYDNTNN